MTPLISICIPAYKNPDLLRRLLHSIHAQTFSDYEIVCTDDSDDDEVRHVILEYQQHLPIHYLKNEPALGSPANWNKAISFAKGVWIKIMHGDDWFSSQDSLQEFAEVARENEVGFIFSAFKDGAFKRNVISKVQLKSLQFNPTVLISNNFIGHPSVMMVNREVAVKYDDNVKWLVDIDFYIRCLQQTNFKFIDMACVNIGTSDTQLTKQIHNNHKIIVEEHLYLLQKFGYEILNNWKLYDAYWRTIRNAGITNKQQFETTYSPNKLAAEIIRMVERQSKINPGILKFGAFSKLIMSLSFLGRSTKD